MINVMPRSYSTATHLPQISETWSEDHGFVGTKAITQR
jgi:hypothetical protein